MKKPIDEAHIHDMSKLMCDPTIYSKVTSSGEPGKTYVAIKIRDNGIVVLGETKHWFWNQLIGCQFKLTFEKWALAVWDGLVDLSVNGNAVAIQEGLSAEIAKEAQRGGNYAWVIDRLMDCYMHVCNNKGGSDSEGSQGDKDSRMTRKVVVNAVPAEPTTLNVNIQGVKRVIRIPDATGRHAINVGLGIVDGWVD